MYQCDQGRVGELTAIILSQCVTVDRSSIHRIEEMVAWCKDNMGEQRPHHPIGEAEEGWLDYFDGDWAVTYDPNSTGWLFWFEKKADRMLFQLTWL